MQVMESTAVGGWGKESESAVLDVGCGGRWMLDVKVDVDVEVMVSWW